MNRTEGDKANQRAMNRHDQTNPNLPLYQQVANVLRSQIAGIEDNCPFRLPNEDELAIRHGVSRGTIRQALRLLAEEGLIERSHGRGTVTIPTGVDTWRRLHKSRVIKAICSQHTRPEIPTEFYGQIYQGIVVAAQEAGYRVVLDRTVGGHFPEIQPPHEAEDPDRLVGLITIGLTGEPMLDLHTRAGYPVVCTDCWPANAEADAVTFDCFGEGLMAVNHLLSLGHRSIFYVGNSHIDLTQESHHESDADLMEAGCRRALLEAGLSLPPEHVLFCRQQDGLEALAWFAGLRPRPTAGVIFSNNVLDAFRSHLPDYGLTCPDDVSLISKTQPMNDYHATCLLNDSFVLGQRAVGLLLDRAANRRQAVRLALASSLQHGNTTQCREV